MSTLVKLVDMILCSRIRQLADLLEGLSKTGATTPAALQCSRDAAGPVSMCFSTLCFNLGTIDTSSNGQKYDYH